MIAAVLLLLAPGLYEQAITRLLLQRYAHLEFLLLDAQTGDSLISHWPGAQTPLPVGSLWKPLLAVAQGSSGEIECKPGMCWLPRGHGRIGLTEALAQSCNAFLLEHARHLGRDALHAATAAFALPPPPSMAPETLIGLDGVWTVAPMALANAYRNLAVTNEVVRQGMLRSADSGTAQRIQIDALAKTGTARCSHKGGGPGDGYVVALWPRETPRYLLLLRIHGTTGAVTAETAGEMLRTVRDGR